MAGVGRSWGAKAAREVVDGLAVAGLVGPWIDREGTERVLAERLDEVVGRVHHACATEKRRYEDEATRWYVMPEAGDGGIECSAAELGEHATRLGMVRGVARSYVADGRSENVAAWMRERGWRVERARR